jgi:hypothetical protein
VSAYLSISIGETPATARPLLASTDPDIVRDCVRAILGKVDAIGQHQAGEPSPQLCAPLASASTSGG